MKILAKPAFSNRIENPYNYLLYSQIDQKEQCTVEEFTPQKALFDQYDILHIHWPEVMLSDRSLIESVFTVVAFLVLVQWMKLRDTRLVWTVHDIRSHKFVLQSPLRQRFERWYLDQFIRRVDGIIALSQTALDQAVANYPALASKDKYVVPHGHYKDIYTDSISKKEARSKLGFAHTDFVMTYFGQIRPYKNVPGLIRSFRGLDRENYRLLIAGRPVDGEIRDKIESLIKGSGKKIKPMLKFIPEEEVGSIFKASNLVVIPYKDILNSGSVILSLSFDVPVLVPEKGSIIELKGTFGSKWIKTYRETLTPDILEEKADEVAGEEYGKCEAINEYSWDRIADQTYRAYLETCGRTEQEDRENIISH